MRIPVIAALGLLACEGSYAFRRPVSARCGTSTLLKGTHCAEQTGKAFVSLVEVASLAHHYALSENAVGAKGGRLARHDDIGFCLDRAAQRPADGAHLRDSGSSREEVRLGIHRLASPENADTGDAGTRCLRSQEC
eukprot:scaffold7403_cov277-Pinguiococcus_pyrenoidosus.AAC.12